MQNRRGSLLRGLLCERTPGLHERGFQMACVLVPMTPIVVTHPGEWPVHEGHKPIGLARCNPFPVHFCHPNLIKKRAELVKSNEKFSQNVCNILREAAEEKMETASQEDIEPEESIYSGGFTSAKDQALFPKFHTGDWKEKFALLDKFEDERLVTFGHGLIFNEAPEILPKEVYKKIKRRIASRILSTNKEKWWTVSAFYSECDEIRENEDKMFSFKTVDEKLKFLDGINDYVMNLEQKYSDA